MPLTGTFDSKLEKVIVVTANKTDPLSLKIASNSIEDKLSVELKEVQKGKQYELTFKNKTKTPQLYNGEIKLTTNYKEKPEIIVPVRGNIMTYVNVSPNPVNFGKFPGARVKELLNKGNANMKRPVMVVSNVGDDLEIKKVEVKKSFFKVESHFVTPGRLFQVTVEPIFQRLKPGINEDLLKIYTNKKGSEVVEVPIILELVK